MAESSLSHRSHGEDPLEALLQVQLSQSDKGRQARLIVTSFANSKVACQSAATHTSNLKELYTQLSLVKTYHPTPLIVQSIYTTPGQPLLDFSSLRHDPRIVGTEIRHGFESIYDLFPDPPADEFRPLKLAMFDMDSTLINEEVIDELARSIGIADAVSAITARAMNGEIDFATALQERVAMLEGVPTTAWEDLKKTVTIAEGARELIAGLKRMGVVTGVVSGGFMPMANWLKGELGLDIAVANHLLVEKSSSPRFPSPCLSGLLDPNYPIVTPELKRTTLLSLAADHSIPLSETLAVGDGSNDLLMLGAAGLGIAWKAKQRVQTTAPQRLNGRSLADLLFLFGPRQ